jgi:hypothetical protein
MRGQWKEVVRLKFKGSRFRDHALDLSALNELSHFQKMVEETAKALWRAENPNRERLPKHFQERTRLCLRRIEEGSAVAPLEVFIEEPEQMELFEPEPTEINEAICLAHKVFHALEVDEPLPDNFPRSLIPEYKRWGDELADDEEIEVIPAGKEPARINPKTRLRLVTFEETSHENSVEIIGQVLEADIRLKRFQLWIDEKNYITVPFPPEFEEEVTIALKNHRTRRLRIKGRGELSPQGKLLRMMAVSEWQFQELEEAEFDVTARPIEDILSELAKEVPEDDWRKLPSDLTDNLDHYLYGTLKK